MNRKSLLIKIMVSTQAAGLVTAASCALVLLMPRAKGDDWLTWPSSYTHDSVTGQRVDQYAVAEQPLGPAPSAVQRSGYRHYRSILQAGQSTDNVHIVEEWGKQVIPYEHWRFPFRPYGVPYDGWGPPTPYGIFNGQSGYGPAYGYAPGYPGLPPGPPTGQPNRLTPAEILPGTGVEPGSAWPAGPGYGYGYGNYGYGNYYGPGVGSSRGFPLQPPYLNQPWYDGTYPAAPGLDPRPDAAFFYHPPLGRKEQPGAPAPQP